jgi:hypothetical protein
MHDAEFLCGGHKVHGVPAVLTQPPAAMEDIPVTLLQCHVLPKLVMAQTYRSKDHILRDAFSLLLVARGGPTQKLSELMFEHLEPGCVSAREDAGRRRRRRLCPLSTKFLVCARKRFFTSEEDARIEFLLPELEIKQLQREHTHDVGRKRTRSGRIAKTTRIPRYAVLDVAQKLHGGDGENSIFGSVPALVRYTNAVLSRFAADIERGFPERGVFQKSLAWRDLRMKAKSLNDGDYANDTCDECLAVYVTSGRILDVRLLYKRFRDELPPSLASRLPCDDVLKAATQNVMDHCSWAW